LACLTAFVTIFYIPIVLHHCPPVTGYCLLYIHSIWTFIPHFTLYNCYTIYVYGLPITIQPVPTLPTLHPP